MAVAGAWCFLGEESELSSVSHPSSRPVSGSASEASSILVPERMSEKAPHVLARWTAERSRSVVTFWDSKENFAPIFRFYCGCEAKHNDSEKLAVPHSAKNGGVPSDQRENIMPRVVRDRSQSRGGSFTRKRI